MKISITEPCHENWDAMTPNQQGAFCNSCAKDVVDFSKKSLEEIKNFFSKPQSGRVCGRFEEKQLQELSVEDFVSRFTYWNFSKKFAAIFFMAFAFIFLGNEAQAQYGEHMMKGEVMVVQEKSPKKNTGNDEQHQEAERRMIKGKVARQVCTTVDPVTTVKGNAKVETITEVKEEQMVMGMIALPRRPEPIKKDTTVKGDTTVMSGVFETTPVTDTQTKTVVSGQNEQPQIKETENLKHMIYENGENVTEEETDITKTKEPVITIDVIETTVVDNTVITEATTNTAPDNNTVITKTETVTTETEVPVAENVAGKFEEPIMVNNQTKILLYPNPSNGNFTIEAPEKQSVTILDENGRIVLTQEVEDVTTIEASHLRSGIYYVNFVGKQGHEIKKITITH
ncbi:MAG: T9SS type A sorting domain-containing protein [Bacteroidia bacterium]